MRLDGERNPLRIELRLPDRSAPAPPTWRASASRATAGQFMPLSELGRWETRRVDQTIYHKNLERVVYVIAETAGRPPAECVVDVMAVRPPAATARRAPADAMSATAGWPTRTPRPLAERTFFSQRRRHRLGACPTGIRVEFAGEGEWKITLDVFRDLGLAFGAAMVDDLRDPGRADRLVRRSRWS